MSQGVTIAAGRPSKYKKEYCEMLINHMASGLSFETFAAVIKVNRDTIYQWVKDHKDFSDAKKTAIDECQLFWEKAGLEGLYMGGKDNPFNSTVWIFNMKNRFGWRDTKEVEVTSANIQIKIDRDDEKL